MAGARREPSYNGRDASGTAIPAGRDTAHALRLIVSTETRTTTTSGRDAEPSVAPATKPLRILHGLMGAAGQPWTISRAQREIGLHADCVRLGDSKYGYGADHVIPVERDAFGPVSEFLRRAIDEYDVFHLYFRPFFYLDSRRLAFPTGLDLLALRAAGKTVVFHFRGSEIRLHSRFRALSPFHYVDEDPDGLTTNFPEETMQRLLRYVHGVAHKVFVPDPELQSYAPHAEIVPRAVDLDAWPYAGLVNDDEPLVVHAPSRFVVKGTDHVTRAVESLRAEGLRFRFELIEGLTNDDARERYRRSDIVIDQLRVGWYGVLAVEAMALGKAVVSYVRDDLHSHLGDDPPLAVANPETIRDVLRGLVIDAGARRHLAERGRAYCEATHDAIKIARQLEQEYNDAIAQPASVDAAAVFDLVGHQVRLAAPWKPGLLARFIELTRDHGIGFATRQALGKLTRRRRS
jgi:glycosyltransferase involved in cell wall biosynthesis